MVIREKRPLIQKGATDIPMSDKASVILSADITTTNEHLNLDSSDAGLETENGGCLHYLYNHTTGGSQLTGALLLMILLYNLYDIENIVFYVQKPILH